MGGVALFVFVILFIVSLSLYEHGYLGIAIAVVGVVAVYGGFVRASLVRTARRDQVNRGKRQQEEEWQMRLRWEQETLPGYEEPPVRSVPQEIREEEERPRAQLKRDAIVQRLNEISDGEFERLMAHYFRQQGYSVDVTPASGNRGADFVIAAADHHISVRLKRQEDPVSNGAVREALGGRAFYAAYEAWLITDGTFAKETRYDAKVAGVRLVDGDELAGWLDELLDQLEDEPG